MIRASSGRDLVTLPLLLAVADPLASADWPQQGGPGRNNFTPEAIPAELSPDTLPAAAWIAEAGLGSSPPAVVGGRVYVLGSYALEADLSDGHQPEDWLDLHDRSKQKLKSKQGAAVAEGEKVNHGDMYVPASDHLRCLDLATGRHIWSVRVSSESHPGWLCYNNSTPLIQGGRAFVNTFDGRLVAVDTAQGTVPWSIFRREDSVRDPNP